MCVVIAHLRTAAEFSSKLIGGGNHLLGPQEYPSGNKLFLLVTSLFISKIEREGISDDKELHFQCNQPQSYQIKLGSTKVQFLLNKSCLIWYYLLIDWKKNLSKLIWQIGVNIFRWSKWQKILSQKTHELAKNWNYQVNILK